MASASWQIELRDFAEKFDGLDLSSAFAIADKVISEGFEQNFYNQVDHTGRGWPPRVDNEPHPLLIKTGKMFRAATNPADGGHLYRETSTELVVGILGSAVPYAIYHHTGTRKMPSRRVIYVHRTTEQRMYEQFEDEVDRLMGY